MRKLYAFNMVTVDGFFEGANHDITWHNVDAEFNDYAIAQLDSTDTLVFGRVTYQLMASYWPTPNAIDDDPNVAKRMNRLQKIVVSRTLASADWNNTRLVSDHVADEITKLKQTPGKDIAVFGSANLLITLMRENLIDEHRIIINPMLLGSGTPLFQSPVRTNLKLVRSQTFKNGNILLAYQPEKK